MTAHHPPNPDLARELKAIYAQDDGELPDLSSLDQAPRRRWRRFLVRAVLFLGIISAAAWGGFFLWRGLSTPARILAGTIEGSGSVRAGEETTYTVRYRNEGDVPVAQLELSLNLPSAFQVTKTTPAADEGTTWRLGSLTPGSDGAVTVTGWFRAAVPSAQTLQAAFTYRPANFSSDFQDFKSLPVSVDGSVLKASVTGPEKALPGDTVEYVLEVENAGSVALEGVRLLVALPKDFHFLSSQPAPSREGAVSWDLPPVAAGGNATVTMKGSYTASAEGTQAVEARVMLVADVVELAQTAASARTDMLGGTLDFRLLVNGGEDDLTLDSGGVLRVSIPYGNRGSQTVNDVSFRLAAETGGPAAPIDWEKAVGIADGVRTGNVLIWDKTDLPDLAALAPKSEGVIDVTLPMPASFDPKTMSDRFTLTLTAAIKGVGSVVSPRTVSATPLAVLVNSDLVASAEARYFTPTGEPVGRGPLPPKAGETTAYRVYWTLENRLHPLSDIRMSATLPTDAGWIDQKDAAAGTVAFDETTRTVSWTVPAWPEGTPIIQAWFDVVTAPSDADVGSFLKLVNAAGAEATDTLTKARLSRALPEITSELPTDEDAKGKGVVVE